MGFCWVTLNVKDMDKSLEFYRKIVGLKVQRKMSPRPGTDIVFLGFDDSGTEVELIRNAEINVPSFGRDVSLGFEVESLERTIELVKSSGISEIEGPIQPAPFIKFIFINDPDGVRIQFVENIRQ